MPRVDWENHPCRNYSLGTINAMIYRVRADLRWLRRYHPSEAAPSVDRLRLYLQWRNHLYRQQNRISSRRVIGYDTLNGKVIFASERRG